MRRRFLNVTLAMGLIAGLFSSLLGVATVSASPEEPGQNAIFYPFVYNNTVIDGHTGTFTGSITVQNVENFPIDITIWDAAMANVLGGMSNVRVNPRASLTFSAAALGLKDGGQGVVVTAWWDPQAVTDMRALVPFVDDYGVFYGTRGSDKDGKDKIHDIHVRPCRVTVPGYDGVDFTWSWDGTYVIIDWGLKGNEPAAGAQYEVDVWYCGVPRIAGVEKHNNGAGVVDGYSAVPLSDLADAADAQGSSDIFGDMIYSVPERDLNWQSRWVQPIVQSDWNGWDTIERVTDVSGRGGNSYTVYFYPANGQGYAGNSYVLADGVLARGQTVSIDVKAALASVGVTAGTVGSLWIDSTWATVALADRAKSETYMELTNVAQPRTDALRQGYPGITTEFTPAYGEARIRYAPLVFMDYNGWNTGMNMANLSSNDNRVTIEYFNYLGISLTIDSKVIPSRAMEYVYRPYTNDIGLGSSGGREQIASAVITADYPVAVDVDEVKYVGGQGQGHAMSYAAQSAVPGSIAIDYTGNFDCGECGYLDQRSLGRFFYVTELALPLVQKGNPTTGYGPTSGMNLFNPDPNEGVWGFVQFQDGSGVPVAPTVMADDAEHPIMTKFGPLTSKTVYTMDFSEMPAGFRGSAVVGVVATSFINGILGKGSLVGVSNNVDYGEAHDGSAAFNMAVAAFHAIPYDREDVDIVGSVCPTLTVGGVTAGYPQSEDPCIWRGDVLDGHLNPFGPDAAP